MTEVSKQDLRKYAWDYFAIHAGQRMSAFQFFITLATAVVAGYLLLVRNTGGEKWMAIFGALLAFLSFVFFKLDQRTRDLVKNGERALKYLDADLHIESEARPNPLELFDCDDRAVDGKKNIIPFTGHFSYSRCFKYVFFGFGLLGLLGVVCSILFFPMSNNGQSGAGIVDRPDVNILCIGSIAARNMNCIDSAGGRENGR